ncbi:MAG: cytochrome c [Gammaproteobacteria bacterium]|nr:cytochrome c [Gammaproteobacteria bacterium]
MKIILFLLTFISLSAQAASFTDGNAKRGGELFEKYKCSSCHEARVGGDGSAIFTRADRTVRSADNLIVQMERCSGAIGKQLTSQEKQDLAAWLNQRYYHFK